MYTADMLVGRPASAMRASSFGDCAFGLSVNTTSLRYGAPRIRNALFIRCTKSSQCENHQIAETFLALAALGHVGNERSPGQRSDANTRLSHFCPYGTLNYYPKRNLNQIELINNTTGSCTENSN